MCFFFSKSSMLKNKSNAWDGFHSSSGHANLAVARPRMVNCNCSLIRISPLVGCHLGIWLLLLFFIFSEEIRVIENIHLPKGCSTLGWMWMCVTVSRFFFPTRCFKFCLTILTKADSLVLFTVALSGLCQKPQTKNPKHQKNQETQTQETPTPTLKIFISFEPKTITFTSCVPDLRPFSLEHFRKPNSPWEKRKKKKKKMGCSTY